MNRDLVSKKVSFLFNTLQIRIKIIQIRLTINHNWNAVKVSIDLPAIHGTVSELNPKH